MNFSHNNNQLNENMNGATVSEKLFVEKHAPSEQKESTNQHGSKLAMFLESDFRSIGYRDGYRYSSADVMDNSMRLIRSEFREIVDHMIEECRGIISQLLNQAVELRHISLKGDEKLTIRIEMIKETIVKLVQEKENSTMDEGLIMKAIHQYRDGFIRGVNDNNDELLLMSYNGLFK